MKASLLIVLLFCVGCTITLPKEAPDPDPPILNPRVDKAWAKVMDFYSLPEGLVAKIVIKPTYDGGNEVVAWTPFYPGSIIYIDPTFIDEATDTEIEATLVHEMWHIWDMKINRYGPNDQAKMERRAYRAEGIYRGWQECLMVKQ